jgi:23S rRNA (cytosine1962-C5)-methyltransferase
MPTLRVTRRASEKIRAGHLWVYRTDLETQQNDDLEPGALVTLVDTRNIPLGTALYSSASRASPIFRVRTISPTFAHALRRRWLCATSLCRSPPRPTRIG